ncbi:hypothetical protein F0919_17705 [Taibaiella lutea]|uniref:Lipoprotein n=1 Tax=Taibaiella lutea TaxID=2608001 RepID=A0A5M6CBP2_9BACT|nr:hypothetical protein [Taibaiella lutea]KAA5532618.1 hypothetical protein F0919_17705 [Taibaiella lutea]
MTQKNPLTITLSIALLLSLGCTKTPNDKPEAPKLEDFTVTINGTKHVLDSSQVTIYQGRTTEIKINADLIIVLYAPDWNPPIDTYRLGGGTIETFGKYGYLYPRSGEIIRINRNDTNFYEWIFKAQLRPNNKDSVAMIITDGHVKKRRN